MKTITRAIISFILAAAMAMSAIACDMQPDEDPEHSETTETVSGEPTVTTDAPEEKTGTESEASDPVTGTYIEPDIGAQPSMPETEADHTHTYTSSVTKEATCLKAGEETFICECGDSYTEIIPATGHTYTDEVTMAASCTEPGVKTYTCSCGESYTETIPETGHSYVKTDEKTDSSSVGGKTVTTTVTTYTCSGCKDSYSDARTETDDKNHTHVYTSKVTKEATCTANGVETYTCACGSSYTKTIPATGHNYTSMKDTKVATCTENGVRVYTCKCGASYTGVLPALGHDMTYSTKRATCQKDGEKLYYCARYWYDADTRQYVYCDEEYTESIPATGHIYEITKTVGKGYGGTADYPQFSKTTYTYKCYSCDDSYTVFEIRLDVLELVNGELKIASTHYCTSEVIREADCIYYQRETFTCIDCGQSWTRDTDRALGHDYTTKVVAPTDTEQGYTLHTCVVCGYSYKTDYTSATHKHSYTSSITKAATCTSAGVRTYKCACGDSYTESIPATGHVWKTVTIHHDAEYGTRDITETYVHQKVYATYHVEDDGVAVNFNRDTFLNEAIELGLTDLYNAIINKRIGTYEQLAAVDPMFAKYYSRYADDKGCSNGFIGNPTCRGHFFVTQMDVIFNKAKPLCMVIQTDPGETETKVLNIDDDVEWLYHYAPFEYYEMTYSGGTFERGYSSTNSFRHDIFLIEKSKTPPRSNDMPSYLAGNWDGPYVYTEEFEKVVGTETYVVTPAYDETVTTCTRCGASDNRTNSGDSAAMAAPVAVATPDAVAAAACGITAIGIQGAASTAKLAAEYYGKPEQHEAGKSFAIRLPAKAWESFDSGKFKHINARIA